LPPTDLYCHRIAHFGRVDEGRSVLEPCLGCHIRVSNLLSVLSNPYQADDPGRCRRHSLGHCIGLYARSDLLNASTFLAADYYGDFAAGGSRVLRDAWLDQIDTIPATDLMEKMRT